MKTFAIIFAVLFGIFEIVGFVLGCRECKTLEKLPQDPEFDDCF